MEWYFVVLIVLGGLALVYTILTFFIGKKLLKMATQPIAHTEEEARIAQAQNEGLSYDDYDNKWDKQDFEIVGVHGKIRGVLVFNPDDVNKTRHKVAVIAHGHTWNKLNSLKYAIPFYDNGYNVVMYDHAYFGKSDGDYTTLGYYECRDLGFVVEYVRSKFGNDAIIALHGESMGAATVLGALSVVGGISMVVADCPFSDTMKYYRELCTQVTHLPSFPIVDFANMISKRKFGYDFSKYKPIESVRNSDVPICFIHGKADTFISCHHSQDMFAVCKNKLSELHLVEGAEHAGSHRTNNAAYRKTVTDFVNKVERSLNEIDTNDN